MYPDDFNSYSLDGLLELIDHLNQTDGIRRGALTNSQAKNLLAKLATVRANLDQTVQHLDETIAVLSMV